MIPKLAWLLAEEAVEEHLESINETIWMQYEDEEKYYDRTKAAYELYTHSKSILHEKNESTGKYGWRLTDMGCEEWDDFIVSYIKKSGSVSLSSIASDMKFYYARGDDNYWDVFRREEKISIEDKKEFVEWRLEYLEKSDIIEHDKLFDSYFLKGRIEDYTSLDRMIVLKITQGVNTRKRIGESLDSWVRERYHSLKWSGQSVRELVDERIDGLFRSGTVKRGQTSREIVFSNMIGYNK